MEDCVEALDAEVEILRVATDFLWDCKTVCVDVFVCLTLPGALFLAFVVPAMVKVE